MLLNLEHYPLVTLCSNLLRVSPFCHSWDLSTASHCASVRLPLRFEVLEYCFKATNHPVQCERGARDNRRSPVLLMMCQQRFDPHSLSTHNEKILPPLKILDQTHDP